MAEEGALGVIGGSGLYSTAGLKVEEGVALSTPFGMPSDSYVVGGLAGRQVVFLPRHGCTHSILPGELNSRANTWGFKKLGIDRIVSVSAVGSMKAAKLAREAEICYATVALVTRPEQMPAETWRKLDIIVGKCVE